MQIHEGHDSDYVEKNIKKNIYNYIQPDIIDAPFETIVSLYN